jgi:hypothetical protein
MLDGNERSDCESGVVDSISTSSTNSISSVRTTEARNITSLVCLKIAAGLEAVEGALLLNFLNS